MTTNHHFWAPCESGGGDRHKNVQLRKLCDLDLRSGQGHGGAHMWWRSTHTHQTRSKSEKLCGRTDGHTDTSEFQSTRSSAGDDLRMQHMMAYLIAGPNTDWTRLTQCRRMYARNCMNLFSWWSHAFLYNYNCTRNSIRFHPLKIGLNWLDASLSNVTEEDVHLVCLQQKHFINNNSVQCDNTITSGQSNLT